MAPSISNPPAPSPSASAASPKAKQNLQVKIDEHWYNLEQWQYTHPGGPQILNHFAGKDATDAFYAIHSREAAHRLPKLSRRLPPGPAPAVGVAGSDGVVVQEHIASFRKLRIQLEQEGWFNRSIFWELFYILEVYSLAVGGTWLALTGHPILAVLAIGLAMQQGGWTGHDYQHGRGDYCWWIGRFTACGLNAFSPNWWSQKHNTHHAWPNMHGVDEDIANDPVFHLWIPQKNKDVFIRKYQHYYFFPVCCFLYASWRLQSAQWAWEKREWFHLSLMCFDYYWLLFILPIHVSIASILLGGFLVGVIVTATHQSEELFQNNPDAPYDFIRYQFETTRNALTNNPFVNFIWGGMQYQLEHHLFPTMPKYYYAALVPRIQAWARENKLPYKYDGAWEILGRNLSTMKKFSVPIQEKQL
jgi:fatty acid desaturase